MVYDWCKSNHCHCLNPLCRKRFRLFCVASRNFIPFFCRILTFYIFLIIYCISGIFQGNHNIFHTFIFGIIYKTLHKSSYFCRIWCMNWCKYCWLQLFILLCLHRIKFRMCNVLIRMRICFECCRWRRMSHQIL